MHPRTIAVAFALAAAALSPWGAARAATEPSGESVVLDRVLHRVRLEADGTGESVLTSRARILTEAGVRALGQLVFDYDAASSRFEVRAVRVTKPDGRVVIVPADAVRDLTAPVARYAPMYTDVHQIHITVSDLRPGDLLDVDVARIIVHPQVPGQFEIPIALRRALVVLEERIEVDAPATVPVLIRVAPDATRSESVQDGRRRTVITWAHPKRASDEPRPRGPRRPDVLVTTYRSWARAGEVFRGLARGRADPTPEIRARAAELTRGLTTDADRARALYAFVSRSIRYVSLSLGKGALQPRRAGDTFASAYGDCKDKHVLLAALLAAVGIRADPVLVHSSVSVDPDAPGLMQFDHVITAARLGGETVFLDTTPEVAPYGWIAPMVRGSRALLVPAEGEARLIEIPSRPAVPNESTQVVEGRVGVDGTLEATLSTQTRGDLEVVARSVLARAAPSDWKDFARQMLSTSQVVGEVVDVWFSDPGETRTPFESRMQFRIPRFLDVSGAFAVALPFAAVLLPDPEQFRPDPIQLGGPSHAEMRWRIELPEGRTVSAPPAAAPPAGLAAIDFAEYRAEYRVEGDVLIAERTLAFKIASVPQARRADYDAFRSALTRDFSARFTVRPRSPAEARVRDGAAALKRNDLAAAIAALEEAVKLEPRHRDAWNDLGRAYLRAGRLDDSAFAFRKQIEIVPEHRYAWNNLGLALERKGQVDEALRAFRRQLEIVPDEQRTRTNLALLLTRSGRDGAREALEAALALDPKNARLLVELGRTQLARHDPAAALAAFERAASAAPGPDVWNDAAYLLGDAGVSLDRASAWAEAAVAQLSAGLRGASPDALGPEDVRRTGAVARAWDTLGWIRLRQGRLADAERFIAASERLNGPGVASDHLGQILERAGRRDEAARAYARALSAPKAPDGVRARLAALVGENAVAARVEAGRVELEAWRTLRQGGACAGTADTRALLSLGADGAVEAFRAPAGSALPAGAPDLRGARHAVPFPEPAAGSVVVEARLRCALAGWEVRWGDASPASPTPIGPTTAPDR